MLSPERVNELSQTIYNNNKSVGWWDDPNRCLFECLQLVNTEVSEATEGCRKNLMDDHLPHRKMEEVELADAAIRALDLAGHLGIEFRQEACLSHYAIVGKYSKGRQHLALVVFILGMATALESNSINEFEQNYCSLIHNIEKLCEARGYNLESAILEKVAYNLNRADHKRENRAKAGGKSF